jgi:glycosyltransferase involved in cell wall biosynthesis
MSASVAYSIVIPTLNEAKFVPNLLRDLTKQTESNFEVIVVDGKSTDETVKKVASFKSKLNMRILASATSNVSVQRNLGAKSAKTPWVIFMDADNRLPNYFLQGISYFLARHPKCDVFTCLVDSDDDSSSAQLVSQAMNTAMQLQYRAKTYFALGAMIGSRRSVLNKIHFPKEYTVGEEQVFIRTAIKRGYHFLVISDPRYTYSLRRIRSDGMLKSTATNAKIFLLSLGKQALTTSNHEYYMLGGSQYSDDTHYMPSSKQPSFGRSLTNLSKSQLDKIRQLFDWRSEDSQ